MNDTKRSFNVRKVLLGLLALALVAAISVTATLALLQRNTTALTNTFVAMEGLLDTSNDSTNAFGTSEKGKFVLYEHKLEGAPGNYTLATGDNNGQDTSKLVLNGNQQDYSVVPGVNVPKDPTIHLSNIMSDVIMFVEVVDGGSGVWTNSADGLGYTINSNWKEVSGATAKHGGKVYVYTAGQEATSVENAKVAYETYQSSALDAQILADNQITVGENVKKATVNGTDSKLTIYGYLTQYAGMEEKQLSEVYNSITQ